MMQHTGKAEETGACQEEATATPVIAAQEVWAQLTTVQQQSVYAEVVRICQQVLAREACHEQAE
jgi:hypothetical protein